MLDRLRFVAGCDGGGTKCAVRIAAVDEHDVIVAQARGVADGANVSTDFDGACRNIIAATRAALAAMDAPFNTHIDQYVAALAGSTRVPHEKLCGRIQAELHIRELRIVTDAEILFVAAKVSPPALATIVGTGSIAWLTIASGETYRAGGDGPPDGDLGSAFWIGREAVRRGIVEGNLAECQTPHEFARLARVVFESRGNTEATAILDEAAAHITAQIGDVINQATCNASTLSWVCAGGVAVRQQAWIERVRNQCCEAGLELPPPVVVRAPVIGALRMAF